jgi:hypothetical protein
MRKKVRDRFRQILQSLEVTTNRITERAFEEGLEAERQREQRIRREFVRLPGEDSEEMHSRLDPGDHWYITDSAVNYPIPPPGEELPRDFSAPAPTNAAADDLGASPTSPANSADQLRIFGDFFTIIQERHVSRFRATTYPSCTTARIRAVERRSADNSGALTVETPPTATWQIAPI